LVEEVARISTDATTTERVVDTPRPVLRGKRPV
jgi:hypothetical protein